MTGHLSLNTLNVLADGLATPDEQGLAAAHLARCTLCQGALDALRATMRLAAALPRSMDPPSEVWRDIRATIHAQGRADRRWWSVPGRLAAAAAALIVASSATTALVVQHYRSPEATVAVRQPVLPVAWQAAELGYLSSVEQLRGQFERQRGRLSPATIAAVERSLGQVDAAIAEARGALMRDQANAALSELLASNYRQKVELLRRASQLDAST